ncbi:MAG: PGN_0703 family putative restriction endonuclease [Actinomycetota bacterium]
MQDELETIKDNNKRLARTWPHKRYKEFEAELRNSSSRWFREKGFKTHPKMLYCLDSLISWPKNIICPEVSEYILEENQRNLGKEAFPLHKYLHHGLSSQAMLFNLLAPLIIRDDLDPLKSVIENAGINWPSSKVSARFECCDRSVFNEDSGQPTSLDAVIEGQGRNIFIESKLAERGFGSCSVFERGDCDGRNPVVYGLKNCYLHHIGRKYWDLMEEFRFDEEKLSKGLICPFINYYQFYREVLFSLKIGGSFLLLHDKRNPAFLEASDESKERGLWPFLVSFIPRKYSHLVSRITIQDLVGEISRSDRHIDWIGEFKSKYGLD